MANKDFMDPELTEEEKRETILANEDDYLEGLLAAADNAANDTKKIEMFYKVTAIPDQAIQDFILFSHGSFWKFMYGHFQFC